MFNMNLNQDSLRGKQVLVVGAARSGISACKFLLEKGACITLFDSKESVALGAEVIALGEQGVSLLLGNRLPEEFIFELVVKSPGVPPTVPILQAAYEKAVPVIGELELAYHYAAIPFVAITGTNGKTTTTSLTDYMFKTAVIRSLLGGNIGIPLIDVIEDYSEGFAVAEVSSFQLDDCLDFKPHIAAVLNLSPDHLDRYGSFENYIKSKSRIFMNQDSDDYAVLNYDDPLLRNMAGELERQKTVWFSCQSRPSDVRGAYGLIYIEKNKDKNAVIIEINNKKTNVTNISDIYIKGWHNLQNALAATACAFLAGVDTFSIAIALKDFRGVEHRQELFAEKDGVIYINDSKGTNCDSTLMALEVYDRPIILVAGGRHKGGSFRELMQYAAQKVRLLIVLGECREQLISEARAEGISNIIDCDSLEAVVSAAVDNAVSGDVVLLSPACASWDMFENYEQRGKLFKKLVLEKLGI